MRLRVKAKKNLAFVEPLELLRAKALKRYNTTCKNYGCRPLEGSAWGFLHKFIKPVVRGLKEAEFEVELDDSVISILESQAEEEEANLEEIAANMAKADEYLSRYDAALWDFQREDIPLIATSDFLIVGWQMGLGKAQPLDALVHTSEGFVPIGSLRPGDTVTGKDGKAKRILEVFPQGIKAVYSVTCSDGSVAECCEDHLWSVYTTNQRFVGADPSVKSTKDLLQAGVLYKNGNARWYLPMCDPVESSFAVLPIDPYVLGLLLGNGCLTKASPRFSSTYEELVRALDKGLGDHLALRHDGGCDYRIVAAIKGQSNTLTRDLRDLGLFGTKAATKFVPEMYKRASKECRLAVIQGILDTDGYPMPGTSTIEWVTASAYLLEDMTYLVQSLGGTVRKGKTKWVKGKPYYRCTVALPVGVAPFRSGHKKEKHVPRSKYPPSRAIRSIEYVRDAECVCISVEDSHYLTNHFMVTHNTGSILAAVPESSGLNVVAPNNLLTNWVEEAEKFRPDLTPIRVTKPGQWRWAEPGEMVISSYDRLPATDAQRKRASEAAHKRNQKSEPSVCKGRSCTWLGNNVPAGQILVADEAHCLKNPKSLRCLRFRTLSRGVRKTDGAKFYLLSGTPMEKPTNLKSLLVTGGVFDRIFGSGLKGLNNYVTMWGGRRNFWGGWDYGDTYHPDLGKMVAPYMLVRRRNDVFKDLPPKVRQYYKISPSGGDKKVLKQLAKEFDEAGFDEAQIEAFLGGADRDLTLDKKIAFNLMSKMRKDLSIIKIPHLHTMLDTLEDQDDSPILLGAFHIATVEHVGTREGWKCISGNTPMDQRDSIIQEYKDGKLKGLAISYTIGGTGLTLISGYRMVLADIFWNSGDLLQMEDRLRPHLQSRSCHYHFAVFDHPVEDRATQILLTKSARAEALLKDVADHRELTDYKQKTDAAGNVLRGPRDTDEELVVDLLRESTYDPAVNLFRVYKENDYVWSELQWRIAKQIASVIQ